MDLGIRVIVDDVHLHEVIGNTQGMEEHIVEQGTYSTWRYARSTAPVRTGALRAGITYEVVGAIGRVISTVFYGLYVELGTRFMAARVHLRSAIEQVEWDTLVQRTLRWLGL